MQPLPQDLTLLTTAILGLAAVALVVVEPVAGRRHFRRFLADVARDGESARVHHLTRWSLMGWTWALATLALVGVLPGVSATDLGLRLPDLDGLLSFRGGDDGALAGLTTGLVIGLVAGLVVVTTAAVLPARKGRRVPGPANDAVQAMLPTSTRGRWAWAGLSVTAGITEEITYRGLLTLVVMTLAPTLPMTGLVAVLAVLFGVAHWYQGRSGMVVTGLAGAGLAVLYLATGSLLVPMVLHVLMDLRALLLTPPAPEQEHDAPVRRPDAGHASLEPSRATTDPTS